jgi:predicted DNA-binding protein
MAVRLPEELKRWLKMQAAVEGTTVQALVREAISKLMNEKEGRKDD